MAIFSDLELEGIMNEAKMDDDNRSDSIAKNLADNFKDNTGEIKKNFSGNIAKSKAKSKKQLSKLRFTKKKHVTESGEVYYEDVLLDEDAELLEEKAKSNPLTALSVKANVAIEKEKQDWSDAPGEKSGELLGSSAGLIPGPAGIVAAPVGKFIGKKVGGLTDKAAKAIREKISKDRKAEKNRKLSEDFDFRNIYRYEEFTRAMNEYFDITDNETRKTLLSVNEADQSKVLVSLTAKLYDAVVDKVDDIDFGNIPASKGDIDKLENLPTLTECLQNMRNILIEFKQDTKPIDTITECITNIRLSKDVWTKAYGLNVELPIITYNTMVLACIEATSYLVAMCVEFIKKPSEDTMQIVIDKSALTKSKQHMIFKNIEAFNSAYHKGQIEKSMNHVIDEARTKKNFVGVGLASTIGIGATIVGVAGLLFCIVPILRELIFLFYYYRVRVSEFFDLQADMVQINSYNVQNNRLDLTKEERRSISTKQMKTAERFRKVANFFALKCKTAEKDAITEIKRESQKKYKTEEIMDEVPDSASASSALF